MAQPDVTQNLYKDPNGSIWTDYGGVMRDISGVDPNLVTQTKSKGSFTGNTSGGTLDFGTFSNQVKSGFENSLPYLQPTSVDQQNAFAANPDNVTVSLGSNTRIIPKTALADYQSAGWKPTNYVAPQQATTSTFRPRAEGEDMGAYLAAKQAAGNSGVSLTSPEATALATQMGTRLPKATVAAIPGTQPQPKGFIAGYDTNNGGAKVWVEPGKYYPGISLSPVPSGNITPGSLEGAKATTVPGAIGDGGTAEGTAMVTSAQTSIAEIMKMLTPAETETDKKYQTLLDEMVNDNKALAQKAADQLTAEQSAGLPQLKQQFADINAKILSKIAEYNVLQTANQNKPITMNSIIGNERAIINARAADIGLLQALAQGLQGQIETAQNTVNRAIDLKYSTIAAQLDVKQAQLNALLPTLNKEEKRQAQALQIYYDNQKQALADKKAEEKSIQNLTLTLMEQGITDTKILDRVRSSTSYDQAISLASPYLGQKAQLKNQMDIAEFNLNQQYKQAQIANIRSEIANRGAGGGANYDPASILAYAQQYSSTGQIPTNLPKGSFGLVAQVAKELPKPVGSVVNSTTGIKDSKTAAAVQDDITKLYNITQLSKQLAELDQKRIGGVVAGTLGKVFGSNAQAQYLTTRKAIVDELQRMQSGAALTTSEQSFYQDYLPGRFSESLFLGQDSSKKIQNFADLMNTKLQNALKNNQLSVYGYSQVKLGDKEYTVGDVISNGSQTARVNPDGTLTLINQ